MSLTLNFFVQPTLVTIFRQCLLPVGSALSGPAPSSYWIASGHMTPDEREVAGRELLGAL